jgi:hypothetical protein
MQAILTATMNVGGLSPVQVHCAKVARQGYMLENNCLPITEHRDLVIVVARRP